MLFSARRFLPLLVLLGSSLAWAEAPASLPRITSFSEYQSMANTREIPGFGPTANVKFLIRLDGAGRARDLYFLNTARYEYHATFAAEHLGIPSRAEFEAVAYTPGRERQFIAGNIVYYPNLKAPARAKPGAFLLELYEIDQITPAQLRVAYEAIRPNLPALSDGVAGELYFRPTRLEHERMARTSAGIPGVRVMLNEQVYGSLTHLVMHEGRAFGYLKYITREELQRNPELVHTLGDRVIPVFELMPLDLGVVAATITEEFQTPLSHINIKSQARGTPNLVLPKALEHPVAGPLIRAGALVGMSLKGTQLFIRPANLAEAEAFWASRKPKFTGSLKADLSVKSILSTGASGAQRLLADKLSAVGAKAANYGELNRLLGSEVVRPAFGIPFSFYQSFIESSGIDRDIAELLRDPRIVNAPRTPEDAAYRAEKLKWLREERYEKAKIDPTLISEILRLMKLKYPGKNIRLRSSTNSEDLKGFNGAGLYYSGSVKIPQTSEEAGVELPADPIARAVAIDALLAKRIQKTLRKVWASVWNDRAFAERELYGIPHDQVKVGVLMTEAFPTEIANGVAVTRNIYNQGKRALYINSQRGEASVTNPEPEADGKIPVSEELLIYTKTADNRWQNRNFTIFINDYIRFSSLGPKATPVLNESQLTTLRGYLLRIHDHFRAIYGGNDDISSSRNPNPFGMDVEFKLDEDRAGRPMIFIKQARPF